MLSSRINLHNGYGEGEPIMPSDYELWERLASHTIPATDIPPPRPLIPPISQPSRRPPIVPLMKVPQPQLSFRPVTSPVRHRKHRQKPITPEIVIERRHRHHQSSGRHRIITIPLDYQPTVGLHGPPKQVLEIERVRCRRHRKRYSSCYEVEYDDPLPPLKPQPNIIIANPIPNPCLSSVQSSFIPYTNKYVDPSALFSNLTVEMIENLPKTIVYLPSVHLPDNQANSSTKLDTIVIPAEIIDPTDETLSIIQSNSTINANEIKTVQPTVRAPVQPQLINIPTIGSPLPPLTMPSGPFMKQVQDLLQRLTISRTQPTSVPITQQYNTTPNAFNNSQTISHMNTENMRPYPSANIRPINIPNSGSYKSTTFTPYNTMNYPPTNMTLYDRASDIPSSPANIRPYPPANISLYRPVNITPSSATNITPYPSANITPYRSANMTPSNSANIIPYPAANITPYHPVTTTSYSPGNIAPYSPENNKPYRPANITPYHSLNSTPSNPKTIQSYDPASTVPSTTLNTGSYYPRANITPYNTMQNRFGDSSTFPLSTPSGPTSYISSSSLISSNSFTTDPLSIDNTQMNKPYLSQSPSQTPRQLTTKMPRSILRNRTSNTLSNTTSTHLNLPNVSSPNDIVRRIETLV
ncbi:unnamed protein product [Rotaria sp. Silwood1]|nr:unnamed protein product [Rotaria sp. Silwood1]